MYWKSKPLSEVCVWINGLWKGEEQPLITVGVIRNTNFNADGSLNDSDIAFIEVEKKKYEKRRLEFEDIILEKSGGGPKQPVGRVVLFDQKEGDFSFSNFTSAIRVKDRQELDPRFLHKFLYWMYASGVTEGMQSHSTGIRNLNGDAYKAIPVPLPPLPEQRRIVAILDEAFEAIATATANAEKNLANARAIFDRKLDLIFLICGEHWTEEPLARHVKFIDYRGKTPLKSQSGVRLITAKNVKKGYIQRAPEEFVDQKTYLAWMTRGFAKRGDVLFTTEAPLGNVAQLDTDETVAIGQRLITMQPAANTVDRTFLKYMLLSKPLQDKILKQGTGATVQGIKARLLKLIPISYPREVSEQLSIVYKLDQLSEQTQKLEAIFRRKLGSFTELKQSILQKAFSGELTSFPSHTLDAAAA